MEKSETQVESSEVYHINTTTVEQSTNVPIASTWPTQPKSLSDCQDRSRHPGTSYDHEKTGSNFDQATLLSSYLVSFNSQLVTLFTIVFITIMSTFVKRYALWKAQEGAYLADLEQLQGSVSLPSTLKLIWSLGSYKTMSALLVLVWAFYYLGSQAAKDEYIDSNSNRFRDLFAVIQRTDTPTPFTPGAENIVGSIWEYSINGQYNRDPNFRLAGTLLDSPRLYGKPLTDPTMGTNHGPLIPDFNSVLSTHSPDGLIDKVIQRSTGYVDVSHQTQNEQIYTSLQGVLPLIITLKPNSTEPSIQQILGSYEVSTTYLSVGCSRYEFLPLRDFSKGLSHNSSFSLNMASYRSDVPRDSNGYALREFNYWYRASIPVWSGLQDESSNVTYEDHAMKVVCNVTSKMIDLQVSCVTTGCFSHRMRWQNTTDEISATSFSTPFDSEVFGNAFLSNLSLSTGPQDDWNGYAPLMTNFLTLLAAPDYYPFDPSWTAPPPDSLQISRVFNAYLLLSRRSIADIHNVESVRNIQEHGSDMISRSITIHGAPFNRGYRIDWVWIPIDFVTSSILLIAAIAAWRLRVKTLAPDIFGYVSSLTRGNDLVSLPTEGSMLSGMDRARILKRVKVKIGEVLAAGPEGEGGASVIGLATVEAGISGLQRERLYY